MKVMAVASAGGHWIQLMRLRPAWDGQRVTYVTTDAGLEEVARADASRLGETLDAFHAVTDANLKSKIRLARQALQVLWLILRVRPDVVISTGASTGYFALRFAKWTGARTIWVDSIANAEKLSVSGRQVKKYADLWLTQWKHMSTEDGPDYLGEVL